MKNIDIRKAIQKSRLKQWEISDKLGISEYTFCRKLRKELEQEEKQKILQTIAQLTQKIEEE